VLPGRLNELTSQLEKLKNRERLKTVRMHDDAAQYNYEPMDDQSMESIYTVSPPSPRHRKPH
jgi:hypothetical protein